MPDLITGLIEVSDLTTSTLSGLRGSQESEIISYGVNKLALDVQLKCSGLPSVAEIEAMLLATPTLSDDVKEALKSYVSYWAASLITDLYDQTIKEFNDGHVKTVYQSGSRDSIASVMRKAMRKQASILKLAFNISTSTTPLAGISVSEPDGDDYFLVENTLPHM